MLTRRKNVFVQTVIHYLICLHKKWSTVDFMKIMDSLLIYMRGSALDHRAYSSHLMMLGEGLVRRKSDAHDFFEKHFRDICSSLWITPHKHISRVSAISHVSKFAVFEERLVHCSAFRSIHIYLLNLMITGL